MNWIDLTLLLVLLLFGLRGYFRGLFREVFSLLGLVGGLLGAARYSEPVAAFAAPYLNFSPILIKGASFVLIFFVIYVSFNLAGWLIHRSEKMLFLRLVNRLGGIAFGMGKGAALAALVIFALTSTSLVPQSTRNKMNDAYLVSPLADLADVLIRFGKSNIFATASARAHGAEFFRLARFQT